ncbi:uncharacterized protein LOC117750790 isoform X1 [Cyclopterus lumpus]|uniref:uncharacterized protein LOC117750790 isoform X1 n=1 Tax=Cyclopterus lumpus TaxID=8103 RepID=UPI001485EB5D|nr:uncharacterized protein LOC117750790 isoform X1 [Cyclopterus lumpus]
MLKFHSVFLCLMGIMFNRDHAALLSIQLLTVCQVFAVSEIEDRNELVSRGDSVVFTCNISDTNETQLTWTKDRFVYAFSFPKNLSISNFTSRRLRIDNNLPSRMIISNVQHDDAGTYRCCLIAVNSTRNIEWDLKVSGEPEEASPLRYPLYILTAVIGFLLCVVTAVCLCSYRLHLNNCRSVRWIDDKKGQEGRQLWLLSTTCCRREGDGKRPKHEDRGRQTHRGKEIRKLEKEKDEREQSYM